MDELNQAGIVLATLKARRDAAQEQGLPLNVAEAVDLLAEAADQLGAAVAKLANAMRPQAAPQEQPAANPQG